MEVEDEEAEHRACEATADEGQGEVALGDREHDHRDQAEEGDARGEAVEAVDEVDGVRDADDPQHGEGNAEPAEVDHRKERKVDAGDLEAQADHHQGDRDLHGKLHPWPRATEIVEQAEGGDGQPADQQALEEALVAEDGVADLRFPHGQTEQRRVEGEHDGRASQTGNVGGVDLPVADAGGIHRPHALGGRDHHGRSQQGGDERQQDRDDVGGHVGCTGGTIMPCLRCSPSSRRTYP